jgi:hypothetical protein
VIDSTSRMKSSVARDEVGLAAECDHRTRPAVRRELDRDAPWPVARPARLSAAFRPALRR